MQNFASPKIKVQLVRNRKASSHQRVCTSVEWPRVEAPRLLWNH